MKPTSIEKKLARENAVLKETINILKRKLYILAAPISMSMVDNLTSKAMLQAEAEIPE